MMISLFRGAAATRTARLAATVAALAIAAPVLATPAAAKWDRIRLRCVADGTTDISMSAKYDARTKVVRSGGGGSKDRKNFSTEFEAAPGLGFTAGQTLGVSVGTAAGTVAVGTVTLATALNGDVQGELKFSTTVKAHDDKLPFPANWPTDLAAGSTVAVTNGGSTVLSCALSVK